MPKLKDPRQEILESETHAELDDKLVKLAHLKGWLCVHIKTIQDKNGNYYTPISGDVKSMPDWICIRERVVFIEVKTEKDNLTPGQWLWRNWLDSHGQEYFLLRPSSWEELERLL